jgi:arylformamidase
LGEAILALAIDPRLKWGDLSPSQRDAAYDNNGAVKNSAALIAERNNASATYRTAHGGSLDIAYGDKEREKFDLYPNERSDAPCLVFIHGGYWQRNSRELFALIAEGFVASGWSVAIPGYTLAPEATLTEIVAEIRHALDWLAKNGPSHGLSGPVVLSGWSAGGQLVALALDHPIVHAGLAVSGVYDLAPLRDTSLNIALRLTDEEIETLSPLKRPVVQKPLTIVYGAVELPTLVHDAINFHHHRKAAGAPGDFIAVEGADHFTILEQFRRPDGLLIEAAQRLVRDHA